MIPRWKEFERYDHTKSEVMGKQVNTSLVRVKNTFESIGEKLDTLSEVIEEHSRAMSTIETKLDEVIRCVDQLPKQFSSLDTIEASLNKVLELVQHREASVSISQDVDKIQNVSNLLENALSRLEQLVTETENSQEVQREVHSIDSATLRLELLSTLT